MRSKEWIFTRHGTTDIGLNIVNAKFNAFNGKRLVASNLNASNFNGAQVAASAAA